MNATAVATVRAGNVIGGGDWATDRLIPDLIAALIDGAPVEIRYPQAVRPWQHVLNPLDGYLLLAEQLWNNGGLARAWNFGPLDSDSRAVEWVVRRVGEHWGSQPQVIPPRQSQPPEATSLELDAALARDELGWRPRWDLERGLQATVDWYHRYADGGDAFTLTVDQIETFVSDPQSVSVPS